MARLPVRYTSNLDCLARPLEPFQPNSDDGSLQLQLTATIVINEYSFGEIIKREYYDRIRLAEDRRFRSSERLRSYFSSDREKLPVLHN